MGNLSVPGWMFKKIVKNEIQDRLGEKWENISFHVPWQAWPWTCLLEGWRLDAFPATKLKGYVS